jgi:hypothetical protein
MNDPRMDATATLLRDGMVLIAGGGPSQPVDGMSALASAELYDPTTGKFTPTGSMTTARTDATATLLPDGRVLIAGGYGCRNTKTCSPDVATVANGGGSLASAELYDPTTGKFTPTGSMYTPRDDATATLLPDGRVLLLNGGSRLAEFYDPTSGKFTRAGSLLNFYGHATVTLLPNGKVLVVGQVDSGPGAELFDPASAKSTSISLALPPVIPTDNGAPETATLLKDGRVLLCVYDYLVTFDPATGSFTMSGSISEPSQWAGPTATLLPDGRVLFEGGRDPSGAAVGLAGVYDPASGFHMIGSMIEARSDQTATPLSDGTVLIVGGIGDGQEASSSAELLKP